jgi:hypothetical protein
VKALLLLEPLEMREGFIVIEVQPLCKPGCIMTRAGEATDAKSFVCLDSPRAHRISKYVESRMY